MLTIIQGLACAYVLGMALLVLNRMSGTTNHVIRGAYLLIVLGAGLGILGSFGAASYPATALALGVGVFMGTNRRRRSNAH